MTAEQKNYIEENIHLIEDDNLQDFFIGAPIGTYEILTSAGVDVLTKLSYIEPCLCCKNQQITELQIPNNIHQIYSHAFSQCNNLVHITLPKSLQYIDHFVFAVTPNLHNILFEGTKQEWRAIHKHHNWRHGSSIHIITCSDGIITFRSVNK